MSEEDLNQPHITMTETMLRFYVFLGQYIDRCLDEKHRQSLPEKEFQQHLATTHDRAARRAPGFSESSRQQRPGPCPS